MICSFITLAAVSHLTNYLFDNGIVSEKRDFLGVIERRGQLAEKQRSRKREDNIPLQDKDTFDDPTPQRI